MRSWTQKGVSQEEYKQNNQARRRAVSGLVRTVLTQGRTQMLNGVDHVSSYVIQ